MRYVTIGHICRDVVPAGYALGGTATYATLAARALGWTTTVITRAAATLDLSQLGNIECVRLPDPVITTFENVYTDAGRAQILHAAAGPIRREDVPPDLDRADVVHLAPIAREVDPDVIDAFDGALVGVTPQGWLRQWDAGGRVAPRAWIEAETILARADAVVLSLDDVGGDASPIKGWAERTRVLVATLGRRGCVVYQPGRATRVAAPAVVEVDPTGAGDIFAAAFFTRLRVTGDPLEAARFANCLAARSVTRRGLAGVPTRQDVSHCLEIGA